MYLQFIYGKLVSNINSEYQLVARSADLTNEANLKIMAERTNRFWGSTPPDKPQAVGIFLQEDNLVLVKAETAVKQDGNLAVNGDRDFNQHHYIFIPVTSMSALQGRTLKLLRWMLKQPIPIFTKFHAYLEPLSIRLLEEPISAETREEEIRKIQQCWQNSKEQKPLILSALAVIINGKRLLLTNDQTDITPQNWMESILLLLPASIRSQISIAIGTIDEQQCHWATLIVKTNQIFSRSLPKNMIWLNRANQKFQGEFDENTFENSYVDYIRDHIDKAPETLKQLIQQLDTIDDDITLESLADPKIIIHLIQALPEEKQEEFLTKYLSGLTIDIWAVLTPLIIKEDYQQGLVFAWRELGKQAISETQAIPLMFQAWSSFVNDKLVLLLDELNNNLKLAEILLKDNLLLNKSLEVQSCQNSQPLLQTVYSEGYDPNSLSRIANTAPISSLSSTVIVEKLMTLCKNVVDNKAKSVFSEAWQFATNLVNHQIFHNQKEKFSLLDTAFISEIPTTQYLFNLTLLIDLLPHIQEEDFKSSNLYKQLTKKDIEVRDLLITVLAEKNTSLAKLPYIAQLTKISDKEDNFYITFLDAWSPSVEQANTLLVEVIKKNQSSNENENFSLNKFPHTYNWFKRKQPELKSIIDNLQQNYNCENWYKLAQAICKTQEEQVQFMDVLVGKIFPVEVIKKWLPLIAENENVRKNFIATSSAWQSLTDEGFNQLVRSSPKYVLTLTRCLRDSDDSHISWIKGDLLHYLCQTWIRENKVDDDLKNLITSPSVTNTFTTQDWLTLQLLSWKPGIELELPLGIKTALTPEQKTSLLAEAQAIVFQYTHPEQIKKLLTDCERWGLNFSERKEILKNVQQPSACNVDLIISYLYFDDKAINPTEEEKPLIGLLLQLPVNDRERHDVKKFSVDVFSEYILPGKNLTLLEYWRDNAVEKQLYKEAFFQASQTYVQNISIKDFWNYLENLKRNSLVEEFGLMFKAIFRGGIPNQLVQLVEPIINYYL